MEAVWNTIAPYIGAIGGSAIAGLITFIIIRVSVAKLINRNTKTLEKTFNVDEVTKKFAERVVGGNISLDVTAITKKEMQRVGAVFSEVIAKIKENTDCYKPALVALLKCALRSRSLVPQSREEMTEAIKLLEHNYTPVEPPKPLIVPIKPLEARKEPSEAQEAKAPQAEVNKLSFGG